MRVDLSQAVSLLQSGEVVAIPTETVYGLAADAGNDAALRQIFAIKQRPMDNPLIVHISDISQVNNWADDFPPLAQKLATAFWPGPFTLVLTAKSKVSQILRGNQATVALRVPAHPMALALLQASGLALAAPSANKFTQLSPTTAAHVELGLGQHIAVLDGGACNVGIESTIVSVMGNDWQLHRLGMISEQKITKIAGKAALNARQLVENSLDNVNNRPINVSIKKESVINLTKNAIKVPGQHLLHYSPKTPIALFTSREALNAHAKASKHSCAALLFNQMQNADTTQQRLSEPYLSKQYLPNCYLQYFPQQVEQAAARLYSLLHELDALNVTQLLIELPPRTPEWLPILDRLKRAGYIE